MIVELMLYRSGVALILAPAKLTDLTSADSTISGCSPCVVLNKTSGFTTKQVYFSRRLFPISQSTFLVDVSNQAKAYEELVDYLRSTAGVVHDDSLKEALNAFIRQLGSFTEDEVEGALVPFVRGDPPLALRCFLNADRIVDILNVTAAITVIPKTQVYYAYKLESKEVKSSSGQRVNLIPYSMSQGLKNILLLMSGKEARTHEVGITNEDVSALRYAVSLSDDTDTSYVVMMDFISLVAPHMVAAFADDKTSDYIRGKTSDNLTE